MTNVRIANHVSFFIPYTEINELLYMRICITGTNSRQLLSSTEKLRMYDDTGSNWHLNDLKYQENKLRYQKIIATCRNTTLLQKTHVLFYR